MLSSFTTLTTLVTFSLRAQALVVRQEVPALSSLAESFSSAAATATPSPSQVTSTSLDASSAIPSPSSGPPSDNAGSKAGLAWPNGEWEDITPYLTTGKVSWYYSWSPFGFDTALEFVPMFWGAKDAEKWEESISNTIANSNVTSILAFNEPNLGDQANMKVEEGVELWKKHIQPLKAQGLRLGSPAPTNAPSGKTWIQDFLAACGSDCTVDFIALHWYGVNATQFQLYVEDMHKTFNLPVWITEFACHDFSGRDRVCSEDDVVLFLNATQTFLDEADYVERYSFFGAMKELPGVNPDNALMDSNGNITDLGKQYIGETAPAVNESGAIVGPNGAGNAQGPDAPGGGGPSGNNTGSGNGGNGTSDAVVQRSIPYAVAAILAAVTACVL